MVLTEKRFILLFLVISLLLCFLTKTFTLGLYRGSFTTVLRDAPFSGAYLMFYGRIKEIAKQSKKQTIVNPNLIS
jgi:hypothetical protein